MTTPIEAIKGASRILIVGHIRPDGDCLGAGFALKRIAERMGKRADMVVDSDPPAAYSFIYGFDSLSVRACDTYDLGIAVDCADDMRLGKYLALFRKCPLTFNIDHHGTNNRFASINIVDENSSSTCELLYGLICGETELTPEEATLLYLGVSTDTGNFMHSNTRPNTLKTASELLAAGADLKKIVNDFYKNGTARKLSLTAKALDSIRYFHNGTIAIMTITADVLRSCGCVMADTEGLIDYPMSVGEVRVAICMTEQNVRSYKVSFRSKETDVAAAAAVFGGGGHKLASGCVVNGRYEDVVDKVLKAVRDGMDR